MNIIYINHFPPGSDKTTIKISLFSVEANLWEATLFLGIKFKNNFNLKRFLFSCCRCFQLPNSNLKTKCFIWHQHSTTHQHIYFIPFFICTSAFPNKTDKVLCCLGIYLFTILFCCFSYQLI